MKVVLGMSGLGSNLEGIQLFPGRVPGHHLPHDDAKGVDIRCLAVVMVGNNLHHISNGPSFVHFPQAISAADWQLHDLELSCHSHVFAKLH